LVPRSTGSDDEILNKLLPHNYIGFLKNILLALCISIFCFAYGGTDKCKKVLYKVASATKSWCSTLIFGFTVFTIETTNCKVFLYNKCVLDVDDLMGESTILKSKCLVHRDIVKWQIVLE
jgi:hypothetical protein